MTAQTVVSIAGCDWNDSIADVRALAARADGTFIPGRFDEKGHAIGIDHLVVAVAGSTAKVKVLETIELAKGGSDHHPILFRLQVDGHEISVLLWNVYVGQRPRRVKGRLRRLIRKYRPDLVMLQEAYRCGEVLAQLAEALDYTRIQGQNVEEGADCALMFRGDHDVKRHGWLRMKQEWTGPKHDYAKQPRQYPKGRVELAPGLEVRALSGHQPTGVPGGRNGAAKVESRDELVDWLTLPDHTTQHTQKEHR